MNFKLYEKVKIHFPGDRYEGMSGKIIDIDPDDHRGLTYLVELDDKTVSQKQIPLWLPAKRLRRFQEKTLWDLAPGDKLRNRAGLEFRVVEPTMPIFFIQMINGPAHLVQYVTPEELQINQFSIVKEEADDGGEKPLSPMGTA